MYTGRLGSPAPVARGLDGSEPLCATVGKPTLETFLYQEKYGDSRRPEESWQRKQAKGEEGIQEIDRSGTMGRAAGTSPRDDLVYLESQGGQRGALGKGEEG